MGETDAHQALKWLALVFLRRVGCAATAWEVQCPISRYRLDVAGYLDSPPRQPPNGPSVPLFAPPPPPRRARCDPRTLMIECKQSRSDFLSDTRDKMALLALRAALRDRQQYLEEQWIKPREPWLRKTGTSLFSECDEWDFEKTELGAYHRVQKRLQRIEEQLHGETKFGTIARYRLADHLYIAAPFGLISRRELPPGWGLLECPHRLLHLTVTECFSLDELPFAVTHRAPEHSARPDYRLRLLRNIAVAALRTALQAVSPPAPEPIQVPPSA